MATVYLCIGTQKTGTTMLQAFMRNNPEALAEQGYCYPDMGPELSGKLYKNRNAHFLLRPGLDVEKSKRQMEMGYHIVEKAAEEYPYIVLSDEIIWYNCRIKPNFWEDILSDFGKINCKVKVVVYLRRQDDLVLSLWNQKVKGRTEISKDFKQWLGEDMDHFPLDYYEHLKFIESKVGRENLLVRVYENGQFEGEEKTLLSDYLKTIGVVFNDKFDVEDEVKNEGLTNNFVEIRRILNSITGHEEMSEFFRQAVLNANQCQKELYPEEKTSIFSYEDRVAFLKPFEESSKKTAEEFLGRSDGVLFRKPVLNLPAWNPDSSAIYRDIVAYMIEIFCLQKNQIDQLKNELHDLKKEVRSMKNGMVFRGYQKIRGALKKDQEQTAN